MGGENRVGVLARAGGIVARRVAIIFLAGLTDFSRNNCPYVAAGIAYWTLFSLFPLALAGLSILGFLYSSATDQRSLAEGLVKIMPVSTDYIGGIIAGVTAARGTLSWLAFAGLLWGGMSIFSAIRKGINHAWHIRQPPHFVWERITDLVMMAGALFLAFVMVTFSLNLMGLSPGLSWLGDTVIGTVCQEVVALGVTFGIFLLLYRYIPNTRVVFRDVWLGSVVGALLFQGVRLGFVWSLVTLGGFNLVYGSLAALMAILVWAYLSAMALMWGAQVSFIYSRLYGTHAGTGLPVDLQLPRGVSAGRRSLRRTIFNFARWLLLPKRD